MVSDEISASPPLSSSRTIADTIFSTRSGSTGRLRKLICSERTSLSRSNGTRRPLRQRVQHFGDQSADLLEFGDAKPARGRGRRAQPQAGGDERRFGIERDAVLVAGQRRAHQRLLRYIAFEALGPEVDQHQVIVG